MSRLKSNRAFLHDLYSKKPPKTHYGLLSRAEIKTRPHVALPPLNNNSTYSRTVASSSPAALGPYVTQLSPEASRVLLHFGDVKLKHRLSTLAQTDGIIDSVSLFLIPRDTGTSLSKTPDQDPFVDKKAQTRRIATFIPDHTTRQGHLQN